MAHDRLLSFKGSMELVSKQNIPYKTNYLKELAKKLPYVKESKWIKNNSIPKVSLLELIHNHYSYSKNDRDLFINVNTKLIEFQQASNTNLSNTETAKIETEKKMTLKTKKCKFCKKTISLPIRIPICDACRNTCKLWTLGGIGFGCTLLGIKEHSKNKKN
ncbi:hypothetical protein O3628_07550 [Streptococcus anginosus]|uniref:hypothetical protein n=1 Tax=Streptococcus anginosus TaxID=1328 RepID=UPI00352E0B82